MDRLVALCKRRGIVFQSSEIYGGVGSTYDYGPYGAPMKNNIAKLWLDHMTLQHEDIVSLDSAIILHPKVWETSGHVKEFHDALLECRQCKSRFRDDQIIRVFKCNICGTDEEPMTDETFHRIGTGGTGTPGVDPMYALREWHYCKGCRSGVDFENWTVVEETCPKCGARNSLTPEKQFNLMLKTNFGPVEDENSTAFMRPETAQGIYVDYKIVHESARLRIPFGIAQIGKAFRNEITTRYFIFRTREFEQMEMQFFVKPGETRKWLDYWKEQRWNWYLSLGVNPVKLRWYQHPREKLAHYAKEAWDVEYEFPFGWGELEGVHDRGEYDLKGHQEASGKDMTYFDDEARERYIPHIVETSAGLNRTMLMLLCDAYREDVQAGEARVYLALDPKVAPVKAAVFPLVKKDGLADIARQIYEGLKGRWPAFYDAQGSIGRRYRRQDEIGTPFCFTIDYQTREDGTVTIRWRDTLEQERIAKDRIGDYLLDKLGF